MKRWLSLSCLAMTLVLGGCVSINSVSLTSIPSQRGKEIKSQASRVVVFGANFNNDFVDTLEQDLARQCQGGQVKGILTKDEIVDYFLMIVYQRRVTATGYCQGSGKASAQAAL